MSPLFLGARTRKMIMKATNNNMLSTPLNKSNQGTARNANKLMSVMTASVQRLMSVVRHPSTT